jgi:hypothetical protein
VTYVTTGPVFSERTPIGYTAQGGQNHRRLSKGTPQKTHAWHTGFRGLIELALSPYGDCLNFDFEYVLNSEPLRIDAVIIKKEPEALIDHPIGAAFRRINILEYKSPGDYLSISDFHQVNAYAHLYSVLNRVKTRDMTISFAAMTHSRKLLDYLRRKHGFEAQETEPGIYRVKGGTFATQIIESKRLEKRSDSIGLGELQGGLHEEELWETLEKSRHMPQGPSLSAYLYVLPEANQQGGWKCRNYRTCRTNGRNYWKS